MDDLLSFAILVGIVVGGLLLLMALPYILGAAGVVLMGLVMVPIMVLGAIVQAPIYLFDLLRRGLANGERGGTGPPSPDDTAPPRTPGWSGVDEAWLPPEHPLAAHAPAAHRLPTPASPPSEGHHAQPSVARADGKCAWLIQDTRANEWRTCKRQALKGSVYCHQHAVKAMSVVGDGR